MKNTSISFELSIVEKLGEIRRLIPVFLKARYKPPTKSIYALTVLLVIL